jgi:hypothetical protein
VAYNGDTSYSNIVAVGPDPNAYGVVIWPNPNDGHFNIGISALGAIKTIVIYNGIGQRIRIENVNNRGVIPEYLRLPGAYMVSFIGYDGTVYTTKKFIVGHHD